jgi:hypothetical protein
MTVWRWTMSDSEKRLDTPVDLRELPGGSWRAERLGIVGMGESWQLAIRDLCHKEMISSRTPLPEPHETMVREMMDKFKESGAYDVMLRALLEEIGYKGGEV